jgi:hypothetical protein
MSQGIDRQEARKFLALDSPNSVGHRRADKQTEMSLSDHNYADDSH